MLRLGDEAGIFSGCGAGNSAFNHGRARFFNANQVARAKDTGNTGFAVFINDRMNAAVNGLVNQLAARCHGKLIHRGNADSQKNGVYIKFFFGTGNRL